MIAASTAMGRRVRVVAALAWLAAPAVAQLGISAELPTAFAAGLLAMTAGALALPVAWTGRIRGVLLSLAPLALLSGFASAYLWVYRTPLTAGLIQSLLATDSREALEQAGRYAGIAVACLTGWAAYLYCAWSLPREIEVPYRRGLLAGAAWTLLLAIYYPYVQFELYHRLDVIADLSFVRKSYPLNLVFIGSDLHAAATLPRFEDDVADQALPPLPSPYPLTGDEREVYVLVIGEAAQAHIWEELDPLRSRADVAYFGDALAQANLSRASVEMLVTGAATLPDARALPTVIDWQGAAGCQTAVISNSSAFRFAKRADIRHATPKEEHDHDLLPVIEGLVANRSLRKLCLVVHMIGSHQDYRARYAERFARFSTDGYPEGAGFTGAYRNSIIASQDFLRSLMDMLARGDESAFLAFTSDHGENLREINDLLEHGTMTPTEYEMRVPMLFWASPAFIAGNTERWEQLRRNRGAPVSNGHVLPTLLDAMGILEAAQRRYAFAGSLLREFPGGPRRYVTPDFHEHPETDLLRDPRRHAGAASGGPTEAAP